MDESDNFYTLIAERLVGQTPNQAKLQEALRLAASLELVRQAFKYSLKLRVVPRTTDVDTLSIISQYMPLKGLVEQAVNLLPPLNRVSPAVAKHLESHMSNIFTLQNVLSEFEELHKEALTDVKLRIMMLQRSNEGYVKLAELLSQPKPAKKKKG